MFPSKLKLEFATIYLNKILDFDENDQDYRITIIRNDDSTSGGTTDTEKILKDLNRYIECYFFTAMSSLDALAYEVFEKFNLKRPQKIYITTFFKNPEKICDDLKTKSHRTIDVIQDFIKDEDFKFFKNYRDFVAHKSILNKELSFNTSQGMEGAFSTLKRPILLPRIVDDKFSEDKLNLVDYLKNIHEKIRKLHEDIYEEIKN